MNVIDLLERCVKETATHYERETCRKLLEEFRAGVVIHNGSAFKIIEVGTRNEIGATDSDEIAWNIYTEAEMEGNTA